MADGIEEYRGNDVVIRFDGHKCIHSRNCVLGRPDVFVPKCGRPLDQARQCLRRGGGGAGARVPVRRDHL
jgi:hypothetical protein